MQCHLCCSEFIPSSQGRRENNSRAFKSYRRTVPREGCPRQVLIQEKVMQTLLCRVVEQLLLKSPLQHAVQLMRAVRMQGRYNMSALDGTAGSTVTAVHSLSENCTSICSFFSSATLMVSLLNL